MPAKVSRFFDFWLSRMMVLHGQILLSGTLLFIFVNSYNSINLVISIPFFFLNPITARRSKRIGHI